MITPIYLDIFMNLESIIYGHTLKLCEIKILIK